MSRVQGYSLWLTPSGDSYSQLVKVISQLSSKYSTPNFEPHVTLLGGLIGSRAEILSKTSQLATLIRPYEIKLSSIGYLDEYFKCLFIKVEETECVLEANTKAKEIFNRQQEKYMPHLSLIYGNFTSETKARIIKEIAEIDLEFKVKSIDLLSTSGEPKDWYRVEELPLSN